MAQEGRSITVAGICGSRDALHRNGCNPLYWWADAMETDRRSRSRDLRAGAGGRCHQCWTSRNRSRCYSVRALDHHHQKSVRESARPRASGGMVRRGRRSPHLLQSVLVRVHRSVPEADVRRRLDHCHSSRRPRSGRRQLADRGARGKGLRDRAALASQEWELLLVPGAWPAGTR